MRVLFLLVALANVLLFMWEFNRGALVQHAENMETSVHSGQEPIVLMNELNRGIPGGSRVEKVVVVTDAHEKESGLVNKLTSETKDNAASHHEATFKVTPIAGEQVPDSCYQAGPFAAPKSSEVWVGQLAASGAEIKPFSRDDRAVQDYLVFYPAVETMEQSEANLEGNANAMSSLELLKKNYPKIMVKPISDVTNTRQWQPLQHSRPLKPVGVVESVSGTDPNAGK